MFKLNPKRVDFPIKKMLLWSLWILMIKTLLCYIYDSIHIKNASDFINKCLKKCTKSTFHGAYTVQTQSETNVNFQITLACLCFDHIYYIKLL